MTCALRAQVQTDLDAFLALPAGSSQMVEIQPGSIVAYVAITFPSWYTNTLIGNALSSLSTAAFTSLFSAAFITTYGVTGLAVTEVSTLAFSTSGFTVAVTTSEVAAQDTLTAVASTTIAVTAGASVAVSAAVSSAVTQAMSVLLATAAKVGVESLSSAVGVNNLIDHLQVSQSSARSGLSCIRGCLHRRTCIGGLSMTNQSDEQQGWRHLFVARVRVQSVVFGQAALSSRQYTTAPQRPDANNAPWSRACPTLLYSAAGVCRRGLGPRQRDQHDARPGRGPRVDKLPGPRHQPLWYRELQLRRRRRCRDRCVV